MLITRDCCGFNSGQFLLRRCEWSTRFLRAVLSAPQSEEYHRYLTKIGIVFETDPFYEQRAIHWLLTRYENRCHVRVFPQRAFNSYPEEITPRDPKGTYRLGDFVLHLPGIANAARVEAIHKYLKASEVF